MSDNDRILQSDRICIVRVTKTEAVQESNHFVSTRVQVKPLRPCLKEVTEEEMTVIYPGGSIPQKNKNGKTSYRKTYVPGTPQLQANQEVLLFLVHNSDSKTFSVLTWEQGQTPLRWDSQAKDYALERPLHVESPAEIPSSRSKKSLSLQSSEPDSKKVPVKTFRDLAQFTQKILQRNP